jgi:8-oxo-dGTP diphosphatase
MLFVNSSAEVLLFLRDDKPGVPFPGRWDALGGHVEAGETPEACIRREMLEEIEVDVGLPRLFRVYDMADRREHAYWARADFDLAVLPLHEGQRLQWFSEDAIRRLTDEQIAYGFRPVLLDFLGSRPWTGA